MLATIGEQKSVHTIRSQARQREEAPEGAMAHAPRWSVTRSRNGALCDALGFAQARRDGGGDT